MPRIKTILSFCGREKFMNRINVGRKRRKVDLIPAIYNKMIFPSRESEAEKEEGNLISAAECVFSPGFGGPPIDLCCYNVNKLGNSWAGCNFEGLCAPSSIASLCKVILHGKFLTERGTTLSFEFFTPFHSSYCS